MTTVTAEGTAHRCGKDMMAVEAAGHIVNAVGEKRMNTGVRLSSFNSVQNLSTWDGVTHIRGDSYSLLSGNTLSDMTKAASAK